MSITATSTAAGTIKLFALGYDFDGDVAQMRTIDFNPRPPGS